MKKSHLFIVFCLFAISCSSDKVKSFIPGTYYRAFTDTIYANTFTVGTDTLHIFPQTASGSETYQVERSMKYTRTIDGKAKPEEHPHETWTASYEPADKTLYVKTTGSTIAFDTKNKTAKIGSKEFKKIE